MIYTNLSSCSAHASAMDSLYSQLCALFARPSLLWTIRGRWPRAKQNIYVFLFHRKKLLSLLSSRETKGKCPKSGDAPAEGTKPNACKIKCGVFVLFHFCLQQPR